MVLKDLFLKKKKSWANRYYERDFGTRVKPYLKEKHLDFGCGFGSFGYFLAKDFPKIDVYGIDRGRRAVALGKEEYKLPNLHLKCSDKIEGKYDSISCFFVIHEISEKYLSEFYKHLNPNGKLIIFDFRRVSKKEYEYWYEKKIEIREYTESFEDSYKRHNRWSVSEFCKLMEKIGFKTISVEKAQDYWFWYVGKK